MAEITSKPQDFSTDVDQATTNGEQPTTSREQPSTSTQERKERRTPGQYNCRDSVQVTRTLPMLLLLFLNDPHPRPLPCLCLAQTPSSACTCSYEAPFPSSLQPLPPSNALMLSQSPFQVWKADRQVEMPLQTCAA